MSNKEVKENMEAMEETVEETKKVGLKEKVTNKLTDMKEKTEKGYTKFRRSKAGKIVIGGLKGLALGAGALGLYKLGYNAGKTDAVDNMEITVVNHDEEDEQETEEINEVCDQIAE